MFLIKEEIKTLQSLDYLDQMLDTLKSQYRQGVIEKHAYTEQFLALNQKRQGLHIKLRKQHITH